MSDDHCGFFLNRQSTENWKIIFSATEDGLKSPGILLN